VAKLLLQSAIYSNIGAMADKCHGSRSIAAAGDGQGNLVMTNVHENVVTDCVQITDRFASSDVLSDTAAKDQGSVSQHVSWSVSRYPSQG